MERSFLAVGDKRKEREDLGLVEAGMYHQPMFSSSYKSLTSMGVGMPPIRMFPFTAAQWQELQRQALIYKHFMASVPVPPDLIFLSASKSFPETPPAFLLPSTVVERSGVSLRFHGGIDPEPGRCRRTDGKKWRCAKDAVPDHKYCERHLHRSRPRSRKHVELNNTGNLKSKADADANANADSAGNGNSGVERTRMAVPNIIELNGPFRSMDSNEQPRSQDWMKFYAEDLASNRQQWETMHSKIGFKYNSDPVLQTYRHLPNLNYTDNANEDCCSLMKPGLSYLEEGGHHLPEYKEPQKGLIDAWSSDNLISTSKPIESSLNSGRDKLPFSCLTLSMSNGIDEGTDNSPLGGPLAEAFQSTNSNNNCIDLINLVSNSCSSSSSRLVSSPSDVLQKSLVSSDSSSSSPTIAAVPQSEFVFEWMKQNK